MKLIQIHNDKRTIINVIDAINAPERINLVLDAVYSRGLRIRHFLVEDDGTETAIEIATDCPIQPPYIALASRY